MDDLFTWLFGAGGLGYIVVRWYMDRVDRLDEQRSKNSVENWIRALESSHDLTDEMERLRLDLGASRLLLIKSHNGGGVPAPGRPLYASVLREVPINAKTGKDWQSRPVDEAYSRMIAEVFRSGEPELILTKDLDPGLLKDTYLALGTKASILLTIGYIEEEHCMVYMSIHLDWEVQKLSPVQITTTRNVASQMSRILAENYRLVEVRTY